MQDESCFSTHPDDTSQYKMLKLHAVFFFHLLNHGNKTSSDDGVNVAMSNKRPGEKCCYSEHSQTVAC